MSLNFNVSYSAMGCYGGCQRNFYYGYVAKVKPGKNFPCWGNAGNAVHSTLEFANSKTVQEMKEIFTDLWNNYDLSGDNKTPFNANLDFETYWNAVLNGLSRKYDITAFEEKFEYQDQTTVKGFVDVIATTKGINFSAQELAMLEAGGDIYDDSVIVDWKTNTNPDVGQVEQLKFYAFLYYNKYKKLPKKFILDYVKCGKKIERVLTLKDVAEVRVKIANFFDEMAEKKEFKDWTFNKKSCFFCAHKVRCQNDMVDKDSETFEIEIKNSKFKLLNPTTTEFDEAAHNLFSYDVSPDPAQKAIIVNNYNRKWGKDWDGRIKLQKRGKYGLGLLGLMQKFIKDYGDFKKKHILINIIDKRKEFKTVSPMDRQLTGVTPYWYQNEAVDAAIRKQVGVIKVPTSGGKTVIAAEFFRRRPSKTLFIVSTRQLLTQTVKEFEDVLDMKDEIGTIIGGVTDEKGMLTVATIQTIATALTAFKKANKSVVMAQKALATNPACEDFKARVEMCKDKRGLAREKTKKMVDYLKDLDVLFVDECHLAKAASFDTVCENIPECRFRFGLSGTPGEDDYNALELFKNLGEVFYEIPAQELIEAGKIMMPTINFLKYEFGFLMGGDYNDRLVSLFENETRNGMILDLCKKHEKDVILVIVHRLAHGNLLVDMLKEAGLDAFFVRGSVDNKTRESILDDARNGHPRVLVGTSQIVSTGLNLKPLKVLINATGNAGDKQTIQSLGRVLRIYDGKEQAICYDFIDDIDSFKEHSEQRMKAFEKEGHTVNILEGIK